MTVRRRARPHDSSRGGSGSGWGNETAERWGPCRVTPHSGVGHPRDVGRRSSRERFRERPTLSVGQQRDAGTRTGKIPGKSGHGRPLKQTVQAACAVLSPLFPHTLRPRRRNVCWSESPEAGLHGGSLGIQRPNRCLPLGAPETWKGRHECPSPKHGPCRQPEGVTMKKTPEGARYR